MLVLLRSEWGIDDHHGHFLGSLLPISPSIAALSYPLKHQLRPFSSPAKLEKLPLSSSM